MSSAPIRTQENTAEPLMRAMSGFMYSAALNAAARLDIADLLANGPRPVAELAAATHCNEDALYRVLRALAAVGIFAEAGPQTFALSPASEFLRSDVPGSMRDLVRWADNRFQFQVWAELLHSVRTGQPAVEHLFGKPAFEVLADLPETAAEFNRGMTAISGRLVPAVLDAYDFSGIRTLMDVAGGHGLVLCEILNRYPSLQGILFDVESVVQGSQCRRCGQDRCRTIAGDFFHEIPRGADAYYLQHIIHDWDDERALAILDNCRRALDGVPGGRLLVVDSVLPEGPEPHPGKLLDLQMLLIPGGRERTEPEFRELFRKAGFQIAGIVPTRAADSVLEARLP